MIHSNNIQPLLPANRGEGGGAAKRVGLNYVNKSMDGQRQAGRRTESLVEELCS